MGPVRLWFKNLQVLLMFPQWAGDPKYLWPESRQFIEFRHREGNLGRSVMKIVKITKKNKPHIYKHLR